MLVDSPMVMVWRRVSDLPSAKSTAEGLLKLTLIGEDEDSLMYDAGSVILGLWGQHEFREATKTLSADPEDAVATHVAMRARVINQCSASNFQKMTLAVNPATNFSFTTRSIDDLHKLLSVEGGNTRSLMSKGAFGEQLSTFDIDGNQFSLTQASDRPSGAAAGLFGVKLAALNKARASEASLVGVSFFASSLRDSSAFYRDTLGLRELKGAKGVSAFDLGTTILTIQPEPTLNLVKGLSSSGRLNGDWIVFHVRDISSTAESLGKRGVKFPLGIETSVIGKMAYFQDPSGHSLVIWQPPLDQALGMKKINFYPVLNRILAKVA